MKAQALSNLRPKAIWKITEGVIEWLDNIQSQPTEEELNAEIDRLQAEYDAKQYQRDRAKEYPSIVDQLDTLYHGGYDAWKTSIDAVKNKFPKGAA